jgi:uncharacterized membrane protein YfcA
VDPGPVRDLLTIIAGLGTGVLSGAFGVGGAVVSTPAIRVLGATALLSVGTTLPSILPSAASGTFRYAREGIIDGRVIMLAAPPGIVTAVVGARLSRAIPGEGHLLMLATAAFLAFTAFRTWRGRDPDAEAMAARSSPPAGPIVATGAGAGLLSGLLGVGGGIVMVPGFNQLARMSLKQAIATSLACVGIFAIPGTITHWIQGGIDWRFALLLAVGVVPGARVGASMSLAADDRRLRHAVAAFLGLVAIAYAAGEVIAL